MVRGVVEVVGSKLVEELDVELVEELDSELVVKPVTGMMPVQRQ
jgi:hypothetical protein